MMARTVVEKERVAAEIAERLAHQEQPVWRDGEPLRRVAEAFGRLVDAAVEAAEPHLAAITTTLAELYGAIERTETRAR